MTTPTPTLSTDPTREHRDQRLAQLFRASRREGRIHPLQHLIERYRSEAEQAPATGGAR